MLTFLLTEHINTFPDSRHYVTGSSDVMGLSVGSIKRPCKEEGWGTWLTFTEESKSPDTTSCFVSDTVNLFLSQLDVA